MQRDFLEPGGFGEMLGNDVSKLRGTIAPNQAVLGWRARGLARAAHARGTSAPLRCLPPAKKVRGRSPTLSSSLRDLSDLYGSMTFLPSIVVPVVTIMGRLPS